MPLQRGTGIDLMGTQVPCLVDASGMPVTSGYRSGQLYMVNGQRLARWDWTVEAVFTTPATLGTSINIPFNNIITGFLLNACVWSIECYSAATITTTPANNTPIPQAAFNNAYISLQDNNGQFFWNNKPLRSLQTINDTTSKAGNNNINALPGMHVNWQNSYINVLGTTGLSTSTTYSILIEIYFTINGQWMLDGIGQSQQAGQS